MFIPANQPDKLAKMDRAGADAVILDLEDSVPLEDKGIARALMAEQAKKPRSVLLYVRINDLQTPFAEDDIAAAVDAGADGIVLPKCHDREIVLTVHRIMGEWEKRCGKTEGATRLVPLIESAAGVLAAPDIARACGRVRCLAFGSVDYAADIGARPTAQGLELLFARSVLVNASRAAGIEPPVDSVFADLRDEDGLRREALSARQFGFQGKLTIHPRQNEAVNAAFAPDERELGEARGIVEAFEAALRDGKAAVSYRGKMIDYANYKHAIDIIRSASR
jgi:citrate lyase subunit beta/citryl-CoA lyase